MLVEAREEAEPVLPGQLGAPVPAAALHVDGARLPAWDDVRLVDLDLESPLHELVRGAQAADPSTHDHDLAHRVLLSSRPVLTGRSGQRDHNGSSLGPEDLARAKGGSVGAVSSAVDTLCPLRSTTSPAPLESHEGSPWLGRCFGVVAEEHRAMQVDVRA